MKQFKLGYGCNCAWCKKYHKQKYKEIMACKCSCHSGDVANGHDSLCCPYPNVKKKWLEKHKKDGTI